ncbi:MAG: hypothetical protein GQ574_22985 [Crocinitomix sp.]|nr:hypothetical protein [Crocinitomix sp.]
MKINIENFKIVPNKMIGVFQLGESFVEYSELIKTHGKLIDEFTYPTLNVDVFYQIFLLYDKRIKLFFKEGKLFEIHLYEFTRKILNRYYIGMEINLTKSENEFVYSFEDEDVVYLQNVKGLGLLLDYNESDQLIIGGITVFRDS